MGRILADAAVISLGLLGMFWNVEASGAPLMSCTEFPGGAITPSSPAAVNSDEVTVTALRVFHRGTDDRIYWNGTIGSNWSEIKGGGLTIARPAAISTGVNSLELFVRGRDNGIYTNHFNGKDWSGWSEVKGGGLTLSGPTAVVYNSQRKLFVRGLDNGIYENNFVGGDWMGWSQVPGFMATISEPAAISYRGFLYLFARSQTNRIFMATFSSMNGWSGWSEIPFSGGLTLAGPSARLDSSGTVLQLFITGLDDGIWENDLKRTGNNITDSFWSGWSKISSDPSIALTPSAPGLPAPELEVFFIYRQLFLRAEDGRIFQCTF